MNITLNGSNHPTAENCTVSDLLEALGFGSKPVVVELNKTALFPRDYATTTLNDNDQVEIITIAAGG